MMVYELFNVTVRLVGVAPGIVPQAPAGPDGCGRDRCCQRPPLFQLSAKVMISAACSALVISTLAYTMSDVARPWAKNVGTARVRWERRDDSAPVTGSRPG